MGWLIKQLAGAAGPYIIGAVAALLVASSTAAGVQTLRLAHAKADLTTVRGDLKTARADLETERKAAAEAIKVRDAAIRANADRAAAEATELADTLRLTCKGAFNAGYASRRCSDPGVADGGVLPDLRQAQLVGAFRSAGAGDVPAEPAGGRR